MTTPLVFRHGPAAVAFSVELGARLVFEAVMRATLAVRAAGPAQARTRDQPGRAADAPECGM